MSEIGNFIFENEEIKSNLENDILVLKVKKNAFKLATDMGESNQLLQTLSLADREKQIKVVFLYNDSGSMGESVYENYLHRLLNINPDNPSTFLSDTEKQMIRSRQINILNNFIRTVLNVKKLIVFGLQGGIVTPFFGASLAGDLRFTSEDFYFTLDHFKYGIHPTGALPFFLPKYVGMNLAQHILFRVEKIPVNQAKELGLINQVFPAQDFREHCLTELKKLSQRHINSIRTTKQLLNIHFEGIQDYFERENKMILL